MIKHFTGQWGKYVELSGNKERVSLAIYDELGEYTAGVSLAMDSTRELRDALDKMLPREATR